MGLLRPSRAILLAYVWGERRGRAAWERKDRIWSVLLLPRSTLCLPLPPPTSTTCLQCQLTSPGGGLRVTSESAKPLLICGSGPEAYNSGLALVPTAQGSDKIGALLGYQAHYISESSADGLKREQIAFLFIFFFVADYKSWICMFWLCIYSNKHGIENANTLPFFFWIPFSSNLQARKITQI